MSIEDRLIDAVLLRLALEVSASLRRECGFALLGAAWASRPRELAFVIRPTGAHLELRSALCKELRAKHAHAATTIAEEDNSADDLLCVALHGGEPRFCLLEIGELRATRAGRRVPSVSPARHGGAL